MNLMNFVEIMESRDIFLVVWIPWKDGVLERKNINVEEMVRTMLNKFKLLDTFWEKQLAQRPPF